MSAQTIRATGDQSMLRPSMILDQMREASPTPYHRQLSDKISEQGQIEAKAGNDRNNVSSSKQSVQPSEFDDSGGHGSVVGGRVVE